MKKLLIFFMAISLLFSFCACGNKAPSSDNSSDIADNSQFVKPDNYAVVLQLKINPEFELYLDNTNTLLALNSVNADAKAIEKDLDLSSKDLTSVITSIVKAAKEKGFLKENNGVSFKIIEVKDTTVNPDDVLNAAKTAADRTDTESDISSDTASQEEETQSKPVESNPVESKPAEPATLNPKTNLKLDEEYVGNKYKVYDETNIYAGGIAVYEDGANGLYCLLLTAMFVNDGTGGVKPLTYNGKTYYRAGAGQTPHYIELTDTEIIVKNSFYEDTEKVVVKMVLLSDGTIKVTYSQHEDFSAGDILSIDWNYLR